MSDTPRTDAVKIACGFQAVPEPMLQHAYQLERENAALFRRYREAENNVASLMEENAALREEAEFGADMLVKAADYKQRAEKAEAENAALRRSLRKIKDMFSGPIYSNEEAQP